MDGQTWAAWAGVAATIVASLMGVRSRIIRTRPRIRVKETRAREVMEAVRALPPLQRKGFVKQAYAGRWVRWSGVVQNVFPPELLRRSYSLLVAEEQGSIRSCSILVPRSERASLELLREDETVLFEGRIRSVESFTVHLDCGAIVEQKS